MICRQRRIDAQHQASFGCMPGTAPGVGSRRLVTLEPKEQFLTCFDCGGLTLPFSHNPLLYGSNCLLFQISNAKLIARRLLQVEMAAQLSQLWPLPLRWVLPQDGLTEALGPQQNLQAMLLLVGYISFRFSQETSCGSIDTILQHNFLLKVASKPTKNESDRDWKRNSQHSSQPSTPTGRHFRTPCNTMASTTRLIIQFTADKRN
jgi:hypothetical protein